MADGNNPLHAFTSMVQVDCVIKLNRGASFKIAGRIRELLGTWNDVGILHLLSSTGPRDPEELCGLLH